MEKAVIIIGSRIIVVVVVNRTLEQRSETRIPRVPIKNHPKGVNLQRPSRPKPSRNRARREIERELPPGELSLGRKQEGLERAEAARRELGLPWGQRGRRRRIERHFAKGMYSYAHATFRPKSFVDVVTSSHEPHPSPPHPWPPHKQTRDVVGLVTDETSASWTQRVYTEDWPFSGPKPA